jgi:hypothetical protein
MAGDPTSRSGATRYIQTTRGLLSYSQLAPLLAEQVLRVETAIASGAYAPDALDSENNWKLLMRIWEQRFEHFTDSF